ncbi:potassium channel family protein [Janthinobacterium lividum]
MKKNVETVKTKTSNWYWISPTFKIAEYNKAKLKSLGGRGEELAEAISRYNSFYLIVIVLFSLFIGFILHPGVLGPDIFNPIKMVFLWIVGPLIFSRAMEILIAFLHDAVDKLDGIKSSSNLTYGKRLKLSLKSYIELLIGFGLFYYILPSSYFKSGSGDFKFQSVIEAIYFSGATMTTLGYGDISPSHWFSQILVIFQLFCGLTLALVSFTVYTSLGLSKK